MTVVLTGATGFVGGRLARTLRDRGETVTALVRTPSDHLAALGVDQRTVPLLDLEAVQATLEGATAVVHAAASADPDTAEQVNVDATRAVAGAALLAGVPLVHVSTTSVYDVAAGDERTIDENHPRVARDAPAPPTSSSGPAYATTKARGELEIERAVDNGLIGAILRPSAILGAGPTSVWGTKVPTRIRGGDGPAIATDSSFAFVHVDDLVDAIVAAVAADPEVVRGLVVNVVGGHVPFGTYRDAVAGIVGVPVAGSADGSADASTPWRGRYATGRLPDVLAVRPSRTFDDAIAEIAAAWQDHDPSSVTTDAPTSTTPSTTPSTTTEEVHR